MKNDKEKHLLRNLTSEPRVSPHWPAGVYQQRQSTYGGLPVHRDILTEPRQYLQNKKRKAH
ncbi:hypothetical protein E2C01_072176 [Portunus trituberculatus]|uniref:Uncharacterized protein n=1 Tax=Portunus trituberculatus TaxID=210409 RepID=A0A5B7I1X9_PORTR|nr:hypothetical protein [Portunus trituberculatus]